MLGKLTIRNFKRFSEVEVELGNPVVFIGPNNSGKTSALQALALWEIGVKRWTEKRGGKKEPEKRPGVAINRKDLLAVPVPNADLLWRHLHVRDVRRTNGQLDTKNVYIDIVVDGVTADRAWQCGLEFYYANEESFYCRPLRLSEGEKPQRRPVPEQAKSVRIAFLPPMSGLTTNEIRLDAGAVNVRIGEGRTAEVLRNLCHSVATSDPARWQELVRHIEGLFGVKLEVPRYVPERGEITMTYQESERVLDLSCCGRGLHQTLLLLAYMYNNPGAVLLLDEPDAHLEILRQRQIYQTLTDAAGRNGNQIIAASHSEVLLNEAAGRDVVVAFVGKKPHRIDNRGSQVLKSLKEIGFEDYYQAEQTGFVLYLEGASDLAILRAFAKRLDHHGAQKALERPFVVYVSNQPDKVRAHFWGVREAVPELKGIAIFDRLGTASLDSLGASGLMWERREIENYLCYAETLEAYAQHSAEEDSPGELWSRGEVDRRVNTMIEAIAEVTRSLKDIKGVSPWDYGTKVSDDFLTPLFRKYFEKLGLYNLMDKSDFHELAEYVPLDKIDAEVREKLDAIAESARQAKPAQE